MKGLEVRHYRLGSLEFSIVDSEGRLQYLSDEFVSLASHAHRAPRLRVVAELLALPSDGIQTEALAIGADWHARTRQLRYMVQTSPDNLTVRFAPRKRGPLARLLPDSLLRFRDWNYLTPEETDCKTFMYEVFDHLSQCAQVSLGQSYLHAASAERDGRGVLFAGVGGVGKTTSVLKLITENGWRYLSDDLALLDEAGTLWRTPRKMQVYAYNLMGERSLERLLFKDRGLADRLSWCVRLAARGPHLVRRRVSAEELFGAARVARSAPVTDCVILTRDSGSTFRCHEPRRAEALRLLTDILLEELGPFAGYAAQIKAALPEHPFPSSEEVWERSHAILRKGLSNARIVEVAVPHSSSPSDLTHHLLSKVL